VGGEEEGGKNTGEERDNFRWKKRETLGKTATHGFCVVRINKKLAILRKDVPKNI